MQVCTRSKVQKFYILLAKNWIKNFNSAFFPVEVIFDPSTNMARETTKCTNIGGILGVIQRLSCCRRLSKAQLLCISSSLLRLSSLLLLKHIIPGNLKQIGCKLFTHQIALADVLQNESISHQPLFAKVLPGLMILFVLPL